MSKIRKTVDCAGCEGQGVRFTGGRWKPVVCVKGKVKGE